MKKTLITIAMVGLTTSIGVGTAIAQDEGGVEPPSPVELFACSYNEGKGPADLNKAVASWNAWADKHDVSNYFGWTLVPYYFSPEQEFDVIWLGATETAVEMGQAQDIWIANGGEVLAEFNQVWDCDVHANYAALQVKEPPERENPGNIIISFSDCNIADGVSMETVVDSMLEWAKYREGHGSTAGMWMMFPAYGGGGEEFDFKWVSSWQNFEDQGADWDQYSREGWRKGGELFEGKLSCDSSRVYLATNRRAAEAE